MPVFVRASSRARAYTRATAHHRLAQKVFRKGTHHKRAWKAYQKTSADLGVHNASGTRGVAGMRRGKQLNRRLQFLNGYLR